jgi:hypothetical protein
MNCKTCGRETNEIATKTIGRGNAVTKCHRLECGHAWHVITSASADQGTHDGVPRPCACGEIDVVNGLLVAGRQLALAIDDLTDETFSGWSKQILDALDGIPAESGAPSLLRSATTATKSSTSSLSKKVSDLNKLLSKAITAVS